MAENSCCDLQMERFRLVLHSFSEGGWQPRSNYHFQLINNLFSAKFCRTFEITSFIILFFRFARNQYKIAKNKYFFNDSTIYKLYF